MKSHLLHATTLAWAFLACRSVAQEERGKESKCCPKLAAAPNLMGKVLFPSTDVYTQKLASYWSADAQLAPWCFVVPSDEQDVSSIIKILVSERCPFGIGSGGHTVFAGSNTVDMGVTIDFGNMNSTTYSSETGLASIQPGARWGNVYNELAPYGVTVTGGRISSVGVGGFTTGGGYSFHVASHGFACDNIANFEVVLADGSIVNANANTNSDLFTALKGGSGNLGLVTRFDMYTIPYADPSNPVIWGGYMFWDWSKRFDIGDAFVHFTNNVHKDENSSIITVMGYEPLANGFVVLGIPANTLAIEAPPAFDEYIAIGPVGNTTRIETMTNITSEGLPPPGGRNFWLTTSWLNDERVVKFAIETLEPLINNLTAAIPEEEYFSCLVNFQQLTPSIIAPGIRAGGNVMGLDSYVKRGTGVMFSINLVSAKAEVEAIAIPYVRSYIVNLETYARSVDAWWDWKYLNYADKSQDPLGAVGKDAYKKIKSAATKYDPKRVFQKLRASGHKL